MKQADGRRPLRHPRTASRIVEGEVVIVDPEQNMVRMLNPVGSRVWELADGLLTTEQIAARLVEEFDVEFSQAQESVNVFIEELQSKGIITLV